MDNSCIIAQFHLDKLSVSVWFHFRAHFSVAYHCNLGKKIHISKCCPTTKSVFVWQFKLVKDGTTMIRGLRLQHISQNWLCSRSFLSIYNLSQERMRWAITSVCTALRAQTLGGHVTRSITMDASFCCCWLQGSPPGYRRPGEPPGLIYLPTWPGHWKIKLKVSKITTPGLVFWLLSCWMRAQVKRGWF